MNKIYLHKKPKHFIRAVFWNLYYGLPASKLKIVGVTGTDGKTTTVLMINHILSKLGLKVGYVSTVGVKVSKTKEYSGLHVTTPGPKDLQHLIRTAVDNGMKYLVLEVSSHGLDQYRVLGINFTAGGITNVTPEHLDYHQTYARYRDTKAKLLRSSRVKVINKDDSSYDYYNTKFPNSLSYSLKDEADFTPKNTRLKLKSMTDYNQSNALLAVAIAVSLGVDRTKAAKALDSFDFPPGRGEVLKERPFKVIVDFAHTPNGLEKFMGSLNKTKGRVIHVFGCAGLRDHYKRPEMGAISAKHSDIIILTAEDPRSEKVEEINKQILDGITKANFKGRILQIKDRKKAIEKAIHLARPHDTVLITGKGPEKSNNVGGVEYPWDEEQVVKDALAKHK